MEKPSLYTVRETIALIGYQPFDPIRADLVAGRTIEPILKAELNAIKRKKPSVEKRFSDILRRLQINHRNQIDAASLSAFYVTDTAIDDFQSLALIAQGDINPDLLILFYDTDYGASMTTSPLLSSPNAKRPDLNVNLASIISDSAEEVENHLGIQTSLTGQTEVFLKIRENRLRSKVLLDEDPAGFLLIEEAAKNLRGESNRLSESPDFPPFLVPRFVAAGANFAETLYKHIYPVSERRLSRIR